MKPPPDMKPGRAAPGVALPKPDDGLLGVMLRCIGAADGAVLVDGGADQVMLPRLPDDVPPPIRASARPGASARLRAATAAKSCEERRMAVFLFLVIMGGIWG
jgi:hypothetical protein